jgi:two-component system, NarL family, response regulator DegU
MPNAAKDRLRVVIADDSDRMREVMVRLLGAVFEVVAAVATGRDLVKATLDLKPDVVVSDISMPRLTGPGALKQLRRAGHDVPFVLVTADVLNAQGWLGFGADAVVDKRDLQAELVAAVDAVADGEIYISRHATGD